ncbi:3-deoxy-8-phosphooctulonate synthase [candidate division KSB1 bacterium]|nr:3-deoxy-8-phosphooctulonate synthase [candidate division KSB1 bacterium]
MRIVEINHIKIGQGQPFALIAGPCVIESESLIMETAETIKKLTDDLKIPYIFKSSFLKANRQSVTSFTGPGLDAGLKSLEKVKTTFDVPILTDIHNASEADAIADVADVIQIPAFLCRQTDIVVAAAKTEKVVNIKKGQFMAPEDMDSIAKKAESTGNMKIMLTERGTTFGYHNLVVDFRSLTIIRNLGYPVVFDGTHSLQLPGGAGNKSGGQPQFIFPMTRAAIAAGCDAIFLETHPCVEEALCDAANMLPLQRLEELLKQLMEIQHAMKNFS